MKRVGMKGLEFHIYRSWYCRKEGGTGSVFLYVEKEYDQTVKE